MRGFEYSGKRNDSNKNRINYPVVLFFLKTTTESHNRILISINTFTQLKDKNDKYCYYNLRNQAKLRIV